MRNVYAKAHHTHAIAYIYTYAVQKRIAYCDVTWIKWAVLVQRKPKYNGF